VDYRSDQFSFGVMVYEMATGVSPFLRETAVQTMSAVLTDEPKRMEAGVPAPLQWVIARCMEKDAAGRYESTKDLARELRGQQEHLSEVFASGVAAGAVPEKKAKSWGWMWGLAAGLAVAAAGFWLRPGKAELKYTPMEVTWENPGQAYWAPDGKAFAYSPLVNGNRQVFVRYLDAPVPVQLTRLDAHSSVLGWSADSRRVLFISNNTKGTNPARALFTVPVTGGEPEWVSPAEGAGGALSPDGRMLAELRREEKGGVGLYLTAPLGGTAQKYQPWPIESKSLYNSTNVDFAPDSTSVWLWFDPEVGRQLWRLPLPAGSGQPERMLEKEMPTHGGTPLMSFLGGDRHAVVAMQDGLEEDAMHLWTVDLQTGKRERLTQGTSSEMYPSVSPDGNRLLYVSETSEYRFVSMSLEDGSVETVIASGRLVGMPAWAAGQEKFAYISHRNGGPAVWVRENGADRPLVTSAAFPANPVKWFMAPALSPDGGRAIYIRVGLDNHNENWISSLSGGPPIRLTSSGPEVAEHGGSWSPDGGRFAFLQLQNGKSSLAVAKTSGEAAPAILRPDVVTRLPQWSPDGKWITYQTVNDGHMLVSPDGKEERVLGKLLSPELTFSKDSTRLYGIRSKNGRYTLFSVDVATKAEREIREIDRQYLPSSRLNPGIRLSLSPDGKRILYPTMKRQTSLWMLEEFARPGWFR
jgi:Tol biopolymer transport system component